MILLPPDLEPLVHSNVKTCTQKEEGFAHSRTAENVAKIKFGEFPSMHTGELDKVLLLTSDS